VGERTSFQKASASALPCPDGEYDLAVSNLTFQEVSDAKGKREVLREALRVVKPGGKTVFQELFAWEAIYGMTEELVSLVKSQLELARKHFEMGRPFLEHVRNLRFIKREFLFPAHQMTVKLFVSHFTAYHRNQGYDKIAKA
jgi:ubiquinone/menaquinone biosynthesis C-methylase UbiE